MYVRSVLFCLAFSFISLAPVSFAWGQMELLNSPKSKPGVKAITNVDKFYESAQNFLGFDDLKNGARINDQFDKQGVHFSVSNEDDSVVITRYSFFGGKSKMYAIAAKQPTYQGIMTIRFSKKDISSVGFNLSHTNKGGTLVDAYSTNDEFLGRFAITKLPKGGLTFFGIQSESPIAKIVVHPVVEVDEDFAIDDLAFSSKDK